LIVELWGTGGSVDVDASLIRSVLDATADGLLVVDRRGRIVIVNPRSAELWRIPDARCSNRVTTAAVDRRGIRW
jgi:PAS domain-containing protein